MEFFGSFSRPGNGFFGAVENGDSQATAAGFGASFLSLQRKRSSFLAPPR